MAKRYRRDLRSESIQINVGCHGHQGLFIPFDEEALVALFPECAFATRPAIVPLGPATAGQQAPAKRRSETAGPAQRDKIAVSTLS